MQSQKILPHQQMNGQKQRIVNLSRNNITFNLVLRDQLHYCPDDQSLCLTLSQYFISNSLQY